MSEAVNHPPHYTGHPSGVEAIQICEQLGFNLGNAFKYLFRRNTKHATPTEDLKKALWYVEREIGNVRAVAEGFVHVHVSEDAILQCVTTPYDRPFWDMAELAYGPLVQNVSKVLEHETGWIAGAMAFIVRGSERQDDVDLCIAAQCIRQALAE